MLKSSTMRISASKNACPSKLFHFFVYFSLFLGHIKGRVCFRLKIVFQHCVRKAPPLIRINTQILERPRVVSFFFESDIPAMTHRHGSFWHAVKKLTRKVKTLGKKRVLPWYNGDGKYLPYTKVMHRIQKTQNNTTRWELNN